MDKLRLRFSKTGRAIYISHLDLMRTMQRVFQRAGFSLKYSEGYNPHPQISILLPLSVGCASVCELMDFSLKDDVQLSDIPERLTAAMPDGIVVTAAYEAQRKVKDLKWLQITGKFEYDNRNLHNMSEQLREFFKRPEIIITKKTKRGEGESDIAAAIKEISFTAQEDCIKMDAIISAQDPTLNPELLTAALKQLAPNAAPDFAEFKRIETFDENMSVFR